MLLPTSQSTQKDWRESGCDVPEEHAEHATEPLRSVNEPTEVETQGQAHVLR